MIHCESSQNDDETESSSTIEPVRVSMKQLVIVSGKGRDGKHGGGGAGHPGSAGVQRGPGDADVDAANLVLVLAPSPDTTTSPAQGGRVARSLHRLWTLRRVALRCGEATMLTP